MTEKIWTNKEFFSLSKEQQTGCFKFEWGVVVWYKNGSIHREDGPAYEDLNEDKVWYKEGTIHRLDGPASEHASGYKEWWIEGKFYSEEEFNIKAFAILNGLEKFL